MITHAKIKFIRFFEKIGFERKVLEKRRILDKEYLVRKGTIRVKADKDDAWLFELSKNASIIFDIGSNIGQSAILMAYHNPEKIIIADPNPKALSIASENMILNNLAHKSIFYNCFVGSNSGEIIDFFTVGAGAAGSKFKSFAKTAASLGSHFKVSTKTLDEIHQETNVLPDLIKIDVEGAEEDALIGSVQIAQHQKTSFFIEMHSGKELSITENTQKILQWCAKHSYNAIYLKTMSELKVEDIANRGRYHTLLIPQHDKISTELKSIKEGAEIK